MNLRLMVPGNFKACNIGDDIAECLFSEEVA